MADIFISYKQEEHNQARKLANALEKRGWSIWWDPKLRAGERFDDVIETALKEAKCVIVMWSRHSVESDYVKNEASLALDLKKLVPVAIEDTEYPLRYRGLHTLNLKGWNGSVTNVQFKSLVKNLFDRIGESSAEVEKCKRKQEEEKRKLQEERQELEKRKHALTDQERKIHKEQKSFEFSRELDFRPTAKKTAKKLLEDNNYNYELAIKEAIKNYKETWSKSQNDILMLEIKEQLEKWRTK